MTYNSITNDKSCGRKKKNKISQLAQDSFDAFEPFINLYDCGLKGYDGPFHLIPKENWRIYRRHKAGERDLVLEDGAKFVPYLDVLRNIYSPLHVHRHIEDNQTTYSTSGKQGLALQYLDIDAHHPWQTDEYQAKEILEKIFPQGYFRASNRGQNGYLKVRYDDIDEYNQATDELQASLRKLFLHLGILCDVEIKGTITHKEKSGRLGKLPFNNKPPCHQRDETDSWNYPQLEKFKACPIISVRTIQYKIRRLNEIIDQGKVEQFSKYKKSLQDQEKEKQAEKSKNEPTPANPPKPVKPVNAPKPTSRPGLPVVRVSVPVEQPNDADDAFVRNQKDIPPLVRAFWKQHRQYPTTADALDWIKTNGRYSGNWEDGEGRRATRVGQILAFTEQTFDPNKMSSGDQQPVSLKADQYLWWVRQKFGSGISTTTYSVRDFDPVTMAAPVSKVRISAKFVATFLAVAQFCLKQDPLENKAVPTNRIKKLWTMVDGGAAWNQTYFQIVRDRLDRMGVIQIFDRKHESGKAWRWESTDSFPADNYREEQRKLRERSRIRTGIAAELSQISNVSSGKMQVVLQGSE